MLGTCIHDTVKCVLKLVKSCINIHEMLVCVGNVIMFPTQADNECLFIRIVIVVSAVMYTSVLICSNNAVCALETYLLI